MRNSEELNKLYAEWWNNRTPEQYALQGLCFDYEEKYFEDMCLEEGSLLNDIIETVLNYTVTRKHLREMANTEFYSSSKVLI